jgi:hypothetical protein
VSDKTHYIPDSDIFSASQEVREIELRFLERLSLFAASAAKSPVRWTAMVNSGEFNEIFPALIDETRRVEPRRFSELRPVDFRTLSTPECREVETDPHLPPILPLF